MSEPIADPEQKYIEEQLQPLGGLFGEQICHLCWVEATSSIKSKTFNKRILVVGKFRILIVKKGKFGKSVKNNIHLYNIVELISNEEEKLELRFYSDQEKQSEESGIIIKTASKPALMALIKALRMAYCKITVGFPEKYLMKINVSTDRLEALPPMQISTGHGLLEQYAALSHYYKTKVTLDFVRYVEALAANQSVDLDLTECPGIDPGSEIAFNLFTAIVCLRHNTYFRSLRITKVPHINIGNAVGMVLETNRTLTRIVLSDLKTEQSFVPIGKALATNADNIVTCINLSQNKIGFQSLVALCDGFAKLTHGLTRLDLSKCDLPPKGIEMLFNAFERNFGMSLTLEHLDLSYNRFSDTGSIALASWLSKAKGYNCLGSLVLSNTYINFNIMGPPLRVMVGLEELDLSRNPINKVAAKLVADALECVPSLTSVDMSYCKLGWEAAEELFQGLARNKALSNQKGTLTLNLQHNDLGPRGGLMVARALPSIPYLGSLNLANTKIGAKTLTEFASALSSNKWIHSLDISRNVTGPNDIEPLCANLKECIQLSNLHLCSSKFGFGKTLFPLIESLRTNTSLLHLELSENNLGDIGASLMAETLRSNKTLTSLSVMKNGFTNAGWHALTAPVLFMMNSTISTLPTPLTNPIPANTTSEPFSSLTGERRDSLLDLFSRLHYRLLSNSKVPPQTMRSPPRPTPTERVPLADVPEHLSALAPPPSTYSVPYSPTARPNLHDHSVDAHDNTNAPTSAADWAQDESWDDEGVGSEAYTASDDEFDEEDKKEEEEAKKREVDRLEREKKEAEEKAKRERALAEKQRESIEKEKREKEKKEREVKEKERAKEKEREEKEKEKEREKQKVAEKPEEDDDLC